MLKGKGGDMKYILDKDVKIQVDEKIADKYRITPSLHESIAFVGKKIEDIVTTQVTPFTGYIVYSTDEI